MDVQFNVVGRGSGVRVLVALEPRLRVERYLIRGNQAVDDSEIARLMHLRAGAELDMSALPEHTERLREVYADEGYPNAEVEQRVGSASCDTGSSAPPSFSEIATLANLPPGRPSQRPDLVASGTKLPEETASNI